MAVVLAALPTAYGIVLGGSLAAGLFFAFEVLEFIDRKLGARVQPPAESHPTAEDDTRSGVPDAAPTSSIDISATGNVGVGIASPGRNLQVHSTANTVVQLTDNTSGSATTDGLQLIQSGANSFLENQEAGSLTLRTSATDRITITSAGSVGIATAAPTDTLSVNGTASKPGGGSWAVFSDERLKNIKGGFNTGLKAVMQLQPLRYEYTKTNPLGLKSNEEHIGFGARAVSKIIPEAVSQNGNGYLQINNDPILWTMLNAIKEQQKEIEQLKGQIKQLRASSRRRR